MYGEKADSGARHLRHSALHGFGDVIELQVEKNFLALIEQLADHRHAAGRIEFHSHLVEVGVLAETAHEGARVVGRFDIESNNNGVVVHTSRIGFSCRSVTRPMRRAPSSDCSRAAAPASGSEISSPPEVW